MEGRGVQKMHLRWVPDIGRTHEEPYTPSYTCIVYVRVPRDISPTAQVRA